jgi:hypothetical protein
MQVKIHSATGLITNSSTVIFTYSDSCVDAIKPLVNEILKLSGDEHKCDDIFSLVITLEDSSEYFTWLSREKTNHDGVPQAVLDASSVGREYFRSLLSDIKTGKADKPDWFLRMEEDLANNYWDYDMDWRPATVLHVNAKNPKYDDLARLVVEFLYSTEHDGGRQG